MTRAGSNARQTRAPLRRVALPLGVTGCLNDAPAAAHWQAATGSGAGTFLCGRGDPRAVPLGDDEQRRACVRCEREKKAYDAALPKDHECDEPNDGFERWRLRDGGDGGGDWVGLAWPDPPTTLRTRPFTARRPTR